MNESAFPDEWEPLPSSEATPPQQPVMQFGVPRRFGIGTILVVMGAASLLLAFLAGCGVPAPVIFHLVAFLALVALGQMVLYHGKNPRLASIISGSIICLVYCSGSMIYYMKVSENHRDFEEMVMIVIFGSVMGPLFGYLGGGVVGGIFLIMDSWEQRFGRKAIVQHFDPSIQTCPLRSNCRISGGFFGGGERSRIASLLVLLFFEQERTKRTETSYHTFSVSSLSACSKTFCCPDEKILSVARLLLFGVGRGREALVSHHSPSSWLEPGTLPLLHEHLRQLFYTANQ